jgi:hypothetical protein
MNAVDYSAEREGLGEKGTFAAIGPGWAYAAAAPGALYKFYTAEGGTRVPLIMSGPGVKRGATSRGFSIITDITPTLLDFAGVAPPAAPKAKLDGRSLRPVVSGGADGVYGPDVPVGMEAAGDAALWKGDLKLVRSAGIDGDPTWRLYNMATDQGETQDLSAQLPKEKAEMIADYKAYAARVGAADVPAGYNPHKEVGVNIVKAILKQIFWPLMAGLAVIVALLVWIGWRMRKAGDSAGQIASRLLLGVTGALALLIATRFWMAPAEAGAAFALTPEGAAGLGTLRADLGAFFAAAGGLSLIAAWRRESRWLWPVLLILSLALAGRFLNLAATGGGKGLIAPMVVEAVLIAISLLGLRMLPRQR